MGGEGKAPCLFNQCQRSIVEFPKKFKRNHVKSNKKYKEYLANLFLNSKHDLTHEIIHQESNKVLQKKSP